MHLTLFVTRIALAACMTFTAPASVYAQDGAGALVDPSITTQEPDPITPEDIMSLRNPIEPDISPDGRHIVFTVLPQMSTFATPTSSIWIVPTDGSVPARPLVPADAANRSPRWSPDGKRIAFLSDRDEPSVEHGDEGSNVTRKKSGAVQIWSIDASGGGDAVPLSRLYQGVNAFKWSPDGTRIAFIATDVLSNEEQARIAAGDDAKVASEPGPMARAWILDFASGQTRSVSPDGINVADIEWSPEGRKLALRVTDEPGLNAFFYHSRLALLDIASGTLSDTPATGLASAGYWSPDGNRIAYLAIRKDGADQPLSGGISTDIRILDLARKKIERYGDAYPAFLLHPHWANGGRSLFATSFAKTRSSLIRVTPGRPMIETVAAFNGELTDLAVNERGHVAMIGNTPDRPGDIWALDDQRIEPVTTLNPAVADWKLGKVGEISWESSVDGRTIYGVLITPPGYTPGIPIKTITQLHGGPEWAWWSGWMGSWHEWGQMLASHGYAVLLPNPRGSDGQGAEFARLARKDWGGADYQDVLDGVDYLIERKIADPEKLGVGGWSYGGFLSAWAVTHGGPFRAAIVGAAVTDPLAMLRNTDTPDFILDYFGSPVENLATYDAASPVRRLEKVSVPVLVLHNEDDRRVSLDNGRHFYNGLKLLGKEAEMISYPREGHWMSEAAHQRDIQQRVLDWFEKHIP